MKLLLIDSRLAERATAALVAAKQEDVAVQVYDWERATLAGLADAVNARAAFAGAPFTDIALVQHGSIATTELAIVGGGSGEDVPRLDEPAPYAGWTGVVDFLLALRSGPAACARFDFLACYLYRHAGAPALFASLEAATGVDLAASSNATGNATAADSDSDWVLESDAVDVRARYFTAALADFTDLLDTTSTALTQFGDVALAHSTEDSPRLQTVGTGATASFAAVDGAGAVWSWGAVNALQTPALGRWTAVKPSGLTGVAVSAIAASSFGIFSALCRDGTVRMWGYANASAAYVSQTGVTVSLPAAVATNGGISVIYANAYGAFAALDRTGRVWCWGNLTYGGGSTGSGTTAITTAATPTGMDAKTYTRIISTQGAFAAHNSASGLVTVWGASSFGGGASAFAGTDLTTAAAEQPVASAGAFAVRTTGGAVVTIGAITRGNVAATATSIGSFSSPALTTLAATQDAFAGLTATGAVYAWGTYNAGGVSSTDAKAVTQVMLLSGVALTGITRLEPYRWGFNALEPVSGGLRAYVWGLVGANSNGRAYLVTQAGDAGATTTFTQVFPTDTDFYSGEFNTMARVNSGTLAGKIMVWGGGNGMGSSLTALATAVPLDDDVPPRSYYTMLSNGGAAAAITADEEVRAWGINVNAGAVVATGQITDTNGVVMTGAPTGLVAGAYHMLVGRVLANSATGGDAGGFLLLNTDSGGMYFWGATSVTGGSSATAAQLLGGGVSFANLAAAAAAPPGTPQLSLTSVVEGGAFSGDLTATDAASFAVTGGADAASFEVAATSTLRSKAGVVFDHDGQRSYVVTVTASNGGGSAAATFTVSVTNAAPSAPAVTGASYVVTGGAYTAALSASDPGGSGAVAYVLSGADAAAFTVSGSTLASAPAAAFDAAVKASYSLSLQARDASGATSAVTPLSLSVLTPAAALTGAFNASLPLSSAEVSLSVDRYVAAAASVGSGYAALRSLAAAQAVSGGAAAVAAARTRMRASLQELSTSAAAAVRILPADVSSFVAALGTANTDASGAARLVSRSLPLSVVAPRGGVADLPTDVSGLGGVYVDASAGTPVAFRLGATTALTATYDAAAGSWTTTGASPVVYRRGALLTLSASLPRFLLAGVGSALLTPHPPDAPVLLDAPSVAEGAAFAARLDASGAPTSFALVGGSGSGDAALFDVSGSGAAAWLVSRAGTVFDFDGHRAYTVAVTAANDAGTSAAATFTISVTNAAPTSVSASPLSFAEGAASGYAIALGATDAPTGSATASFTYVLGGTDAAAFTLSGSSLGFVAATLSAVAKPSYAITLQAVDASGAATAATPFTVSVTNLPPSAPTLSPATITEGATTYAGTLSASDPGGATVAYDLSGGGDAALFSLSGATLSYSGGSAFSAYAKPLYTLYVRSRDPLGATSADTTLTLSVSNLAPSAPTLSLTTLAEGGHASFAAAVIATDPGGSPLSFALGGPDAAAFDLSGAWPAVWLVARPATRFSAFFKAAYALTLTATDAVAPTPASATATFTLRVLNALPTPPSLTPTSVVEGAAGYAGSVQASDPGAAPLTFSLAGADAALFDLSGAPVWDAAAGTTRQALVSRAGTRFSAFSRPSLQVRVTATDPSGGAAETDVTLAVLNAPPSAPTLALTSATEGGRFVSLLSASDPGDSPLTFALSGPDAAAFDLSGGPTPQAAYLVSRPATALSAYSRPTYAVTVTATDASGASAAAALTLTVLNAAPPAPALDTTDIPEGGAFVGALSAPDPGGAPVTFALTGGADAASFDVSGSRLVSNPAAGPFLRRTRTAYAVEVTATDALGAASAPAALTLRVVNAPPPPPTLTPLTVTEGGAYLGTLAATDTDGSAVAAFRLLPEPGTDAGSFVITGATLASRPGTAFSAYANPRPTLRVVAVDADGAESAPATLVLAVQNAPPGAPSLTPLAVDEGAAYVGELSVVDPGGPQPFTYSLTGPDASGFDVSGATLVSRPATRFTAVPRLGQAQYRVTLAATDASGATGPAADFAIAVQNLPPAGLAITPTTVPALTRFRGVLSAVDPGGGAVTYSANGPDFNNLFELAAPNVLQTRAGVVLSRAAGGRSSISFNLFAFDEVGALAGPVPVTIRIADTAPAPPALTPLQVLEGTAPYVGSLSTSDEDGGPPPFTYALGGPDAGRFDVSGATLLSRPGAVFSAWRQPSYTLEVVARDASGGVSEPARHVISVVNVPPAPATLTPLQYVLGLTYEGALAAPDPGEGAVAFAIPAGRPPLLRVAGRDGARFEVAGTTLRTKPRAHHLDVATPDLEVVVAATDTSGATTTTRLSLSVAPPTRPVLLLTDATSDPAPLRAPLFVTWRAAGFAEHGHADPSGFDVRLARLEGGAPVEVARRHVDASGSRYAGFAPPAGSGWQPGTYELRVTDAGGVAEGATALVRVQAYEETSGGKEAAVRVNDDKVQGVVGRQDAVGGPHMQADARSGALRFARADRLDGFGVDVAGHALTFTPPGGGRRSALVAWDASSNTVNVTTSGGGAVDEVLVREGGMAAYSDARLKTDVVALPLAGTLATLLALEPVTFRWRGAAAAGYEEGGGEADYDENSEAVDVGFVAQQVAAVEGRLVAPTHLWPAVASVRAAAGAEGDEEEPYLTLAYDRVTALLVAAVQAEQATLAALREEVAALRLRSRRLQRR